MKRIFDVVVSALLLTLALPGIILIAALVRWDLGHPIFFRQPRSGFEGRSFEMVKFRTMRDERDAHGNLLPDHARLSPLGKFLRRTSLDELPELWNVLVGDMSLVGPRPLLVEYLPLYTPLHARRHEVRPGITGLAQVRGRQSLKWSEKFLLDVQYVEAKSLALDLRIIGETVIQVLLGAGVKLGASADEDDLGIWEKVLAARAMHGGGGPVQHIAFTEGTINRYVLEFLLESVEADSNAGLSRQVPLSEYAQKLEMNARFICAWDNLTLIGVCAFYTNDASNPAAFVTLLAVLKDYRGQGVGKQLVNRCAISARGHGKSRLELKVSCDNESAQNFYRSLGFALMAGGEGSFNTYYLSLTADPTGRD